VSVKWHGLTEMDRTPSISIFERSDLLSFQVL